jgi:hypothetical protein
MRRPQFFADLAAGMFRVAGMSASGGCPTSLDLSLIPSAPGAKYKPG